MTGLAAAVATSQLVCTQGSAPGALAVVPSSGVTMEFFPAATVADTAPLVNIPSFGMCRSIANPSVAAATAAALGVLTPMPCMPATSGTWTPGAPLTLIGGVPGLTLGSTCICSYAGVVSITDPGTFQTTQA